MKKIIFLLFPIIIYAQDVSEFLVTKQIDNSFITNFEYGKMLYNNPRGVSCKKCHGKDAKGMLISSYTHEYKKKIYKCLVQSIDITEISLDKFIAKLDPEIKVVKPKFKKEEICKRMIYGNTMPKYFLTKEEMASIYFYITHIGKDIE